MKRIFTNLFIKKNYPKIVSKLYLHNFKVIQDILSGITRYQKNKNKNIYLSSTVTR
jgi:hypothetical protein